MKKFLTIFVSVLVFSLVSCDQNTPENPDSGTNSGNSADSGSNDNSEKLPVVEFSVSSTKKVLFSPGNLQCYVANGTIQSWRFAPNQTECLGNANMERTGYKDLFFWSCTTSGKYGVATDNSGNADNIGGVFVDWGKNKIGDYEPNTWRTLSIAEWGYLIYERPNSSSLYGIAKVGTINGLIILPDKWSCPLGITFKSGVSYMDGSEYYGKFQTFTNEQWLKMEKAGAIFLPAAGKRFTSWSEDEEDSIEYTMDLGCYWASDSEYYANTYGAFFLKFESDVVELYSWYQNGLSVRLVKDL